MHIKGSYPRIIPEALPKIKESKSQKVLWNAEQIQVVGYIEKKIIFQENLIKKVIMSKQKGSKQR